MVGEAATLSKPMHHRVEFEMTQGPIPTSDQAFNHGSGRKAAVAVVVRPGDHGDELLVLRRATFPGDPWSGHIALPGGGAEPSDVSLEATARRETLEETGIDLAGSECLCELGMVAPQSLGAPLVSVAPFVFRYDGNSHVTLSSEIVEAWWVAVADLERADAWSTVPVVVGDGRRLQVRAFQMHGYPLWGLTERIVEEFLEFLELRRQQSG